MESLFEGDISDMPYHMLISNGYANADMENQENAIIFQHRLWPNGVIPYILAGFDVIEENFIKYAMVEIRLSTCVRFVQRNAERDYIMIQKNGLFQCSATLGYLKKGVQIVWLHPMCLNRNDVLHELMHVLGFYHEHTRYDRDDYVIINMENVQEKFKRNFHKRHPTNVTHLETEYDFKSVMHYPPLYGSKNNLPTIMSKESGITIEADGLSKNDIMRINKLYKCKSVEMPNQKVCDGSNSKLQKFGVLLQGSGQYAKPVNCSLTYTFWAPNPMKAANTLIGSKKFRSEDWGVLYHNSTLAIHGNHRQLCSFHPIDGLSDQIVFFEKCNSHMWHQALDCDAWRNVVKETYRRTEDITETTIISFDKIINQRNECVTIYCGMVQASNINLHVSERRTCTVDLLPSLYRCMLILH